MTMAMSLSLSTPAWLEAGPKDAPLAVVFLHGIGGGKKGFKPSVEFFATQGHRALAWDMPGYGDSPLEGTLSFESLALSLEKLLDAAHVQKAILVGHSMGGMVALQAWTHCPSRIAGMVIAASSPAFGQQDGDFQKQFVAQRLAPLDAGQTMAQVADKLIPNMVSPHALPSGTNCLSIRPAWPWRMPACLRYQPAHTELPCMPWSSLSSVPLCQVFRCQPFAWQESTTRLRQPKCYAAWRKKFRMRNTHAFQVWVT